MGGEEKIKKLNEESSGSEREYDSKSKRYNLITSVLPYYSITLIEAFAIYFIFYLNKPFVVVWFFYGLLPILDYILPVDDKNPNKEERKQILNNFKFKIPLYLNIVVEWVLFGWTVHYLNTEDLNILQKLGISLLIITVQASSINISHELNHKLNIFEQTLATINLSKHYYLHYTIEHNYGHHKWVATYDDPSTGRFKESVFQFLPRTLINTYISAWQIENQLCLEAYGKKYCLKNRMIWFTFVYFMFPFTIYMFFGWKYMATQIFIGIMSDVFLEAINYVEHYGLERKKLSDGSFEKVNLTHSWNAPQRISNYLLFKVQRHSDHHENAVKPYQTLCSYEESPLLPTGYMLCLLLCFVPKVWFKIMDPLTEVYRAGNKPKEELRKKSDSTMVNFIITVNIILMICFFLA
jgi:alkane 1-monooxygenase